MGSWLLFVVIGMLVYSAALAAYLGVRSDATSQVIGGERDAFGCVSAAGYSYDERVGACTRPWDLDEDARELARIAIGAVSPGTPSTVVSVDEGACGRGCSVVRLERYGEYTMVAIEDGDVIEVSGR